LKGLLRIYLEKIILDLEVENELGMDATEMLRIITG